jgi:prepilin-type N-terminal cleavage/methylation domain-containing protein
MGCKPILSMQSTPLSRSESGFTLVELLVAITVIAVVLGGAGALFAASRRFIQNQVLQIETTQALRATLDTVARDLRLGGACLPTLGDFSPLDGIDNGTTDTISSRTGMVQPNLTCIRHNLSTSAATNDTSLVLVSTTGFQVGMGAYIWGSATNSGESFRIINIAGNTITADKGMSRAYSAGGNSTVYAIDERIYAIDKTNPNLPVLTIAINGADPVPFAHGIEALNVRYRLNRNCPTCDTLDLPQSASDWQLVNELIINVTARSRTKGSSGQYYRRSAQLIAKPRNLLPTG